jgi:hypothetical protein
MSFDNVSPRGNPQLVNQLRRLAARQVPEELSELDVPCDLCGTSMSQDHRHLLHLDDRRMVCVCESCWALRSGDAEFRPAGARTLWLEGFELPEQLWAAMQLPIGLAFFLDSGAAGKVVGLYPSPVGATECELDLTAWEQLVALNPVLESLEPDAEALLVNRMAEPHEFAIAPTDQCYRLVGLIKSRWDGISGGAGVEEVIAAFFAELRERAGGGVAG